MSEFLTGNGVWIDSEQLRQLRIADQQLEVVAGRDEDGTWSYVLESEAKTKRKGGKDLHASDFAFVGDSSDPSTWKLPIHDAAHARNALARFNQTQGIPADKKAAVLAKIKRAAKSFGVDVSESELGSSIEIDEGDGWITSNGYRIFVGKGNEGKKHSFKNTQTFKIGGKKLKVSNKEDYGPDSEDVDVDAMIAEAMVDLLIAEGSVGSHFTDSDGGMKCKHCGAKVSNPRAAAAHLFSKHKDKVE